MAILIPENPNNCNLHNAPPLDGRTILEELEQFPETKDLIHEANRVMQAAGIGRPVEIHIEHTTSGMLAEQGGNIISIAPGQTHAATLRSAIFELCNATREIEFAAINTKLCAGHYQSAEEYTREMELVEYNNLVRAIHIIDDVNNQHRKLHEARAGHDQPAEEHAPETKLSEYNDLLRSINATTNVNKPKRESYIDNFHQFFYLEKQGFEFHYDKLLSDKHKDHYRKYYADVTQWHNRLTQNASLTAEDLRNIRTLSQLPGMTEDKIRELLGQVTSLNFADSGITDSELGDLLQWGAPYLTAIRSLDLSNCPQVTDTGLASLAALPCLQQVNLRNGFRVTDAALASLAALTHLRALNLHSCGQVTDTGLQHLATLTHLRALNLHSCGQVTDTGLQHLAALTHLRALNLHGCEQVTVDAGQRLMGQLPGLTIYS